MSALPLIAGHAPDAPLGVRRGAMLRAGEFVAAAKTLAARVPADGCVLLLCADRVGFALGFAATLLRGATVLLPSSRAPQALERIVDMHGPGCALVDAAGETALVPEVSVDPWSKHRLLDDVPAIDGDRVAVIVHTSGTTGDPQGHAKTWSSLVQGARGLRERVAFAPGSAIVGAVPPQHMWGLEATVMLALQGGGIVHAGMPLLPADIAAALQDADAPRWLVATPLHIRNCVHSGVRLPSLHCTLTATSALEPDLARAFERAIGAPVVEIYGSTETGVIATRRPAAGSAFTPLEGVLVADRREGIGVRGGHLDGEIALRDRAILHGDGRFTLSGRDADLVKIGGKRASLAMLNATLTSIEGVVDGTFVAAEDDAPDRRLAALAVAPGTTAEAILAALRQRLDTVFVPRPLHLVAALPRDALGKLSLARLREMLQAPSRAGDDAAATRTHVCEVAVPATHPALPGHFPGRPIVPAAWILTLVASACREAFGVPAASLRLARARFRAPLRPEATLRIVLDRRDDRSIAFACTHGEVRIADGSFVIEEARP